MATTKMRRRRFWFIPRFGLRTFLVVSILIGTVLGPFAHRTRQQILVYSALEKQGIDFQQSDPPYWARLLPESWLDIADGQWYLTIESVELNASSRFSNMLMSPDEQVTFLNEHSKQLTRLSSLKKLEICGIDGPVDLKQLRPMFESIANISGLNEIIIRSHQLIDFDAILAMTPRMPKLVKLSLLSEGKLTNAGLAGIDKFPALEELTFFSEQVDDDCLKDLASMTHVKKISAMHSRFSLAGLTCFANHPTLEQLDCATSCTDDMLEIFSSCPNMREVHASDSLVTDEGLAHIQKLKKLESISLSQTCVSDVGLAHLANCKELKKVWCEGCKITNASGRTLSQLPQLESVNLQHTLITQDLLPQLHDLKQLREFDARNLVMDAKRVLDFGSDHPGIVHVYGVSWDNALVHLGGNGYLNPYEQEQLNLPNIQGLAGQIGKVRDLKEARDVNLSGADINDDDLLTLALTCNLRSVDLRGAPVTPDGLSVLANQNLLTELHVGPFDDADRAMEVISKIPTLVSLEFVGGDRLSQSGKDHLLKLGGLKTLDMLDCVFDEALMRKLAKHANLRVARWLDKVCKGPYKENKKRSLWLESLPQSLQSAFLGEFEFDEIKVSTEKELIALTPQIARNLNVSGVQLSRDGIAAISNMQALYKLNLSRTGINDEMIKPLGLLTLLRELDLSDNPVSDFSGQSLTNILHGLDSLNLAGTQITNESLATMMQSLRLSRIDLSRTSLTQKAWELTPRQNQSRFGYLSVVSVVAAPDIIQGFANAPKGLLPAQIQTRRGFGLTADALMIMFGHKPASALTKLEITPEVIQAWSIKDLLQDKEYLDCLSVVESGRVGEILTTSRSECPYLRQLVFVGERLEADQMRQLPLSLRELYLKDCTLAPQAMEAIAENGLIRRIYFDGCNLDGCSLEPLTHMKYLASVLCNNQELSSDQQNTLTRLKPALVEAVGW